MTADAAELHRRARKLLPRNVYDYYAGGSGRERTLRASEKAWRQVWLVPRVLRDVSSLDTATRLPGGCRADLVPGRDAEAARAYLGTVRATPRSRREHASVVTEARRPMSEDIKYREHRYLIMMGIRLVCFVIAVVLFVNGAGWLTAIPAVGAIAIPYFAVVFANGGREPAGRSGFRPYMPNLPERFAAPSRSQRPDGIADTDTAKPGEADIPGTNGASERSG